MCRLPVTLGGGIGTTYAGRASVGESVVAKTPSFSQYAYHRGSTTAGSYGWSSAGVAAGVEASVIGPQEIARGPRRFHAPGGRCCFDSGSGSGSDSGSGSRVDSGLTA